MRRILRWIVFGTGTVVLAVVALGVATYLTLAFAPAVGTPSKAAFHESVADEAGGIVTKCCMSDVCRPLGPRTWRCTVSDPSRSGDVAYRVSRHGTRCWEARLLSDPVWDAEQPPPVHMNGCVTLGDQLWGSEMASDLQSP